MVDALLRSWYGVYEFTDNPACIFRVGMSRARRRIAVGRHPHSRRRGHRHAAFLERAFAALSLARAGSALGARDARSGRAFDGLLADYVEKEPVWREVQAFYGEGVFFSGRIGMPQIERVCMRFGYEQVPSESVPLRRRVHLFCENFTLWGLTRAFQPAALSRRPFVRPRQELWLSRARLLGFARHHAELRAKAAQPRAS